MAASDGEKDSTEKHDGARPERRLCLGLPPPGDPLRRGAPEDTTRLSAALLLPLLECWPCLKLGTARGGCTDIAGTSGPCLIGIVLDGLSRGVCSAEEKGLRSEAGV